MVTKTFLAALTAMLVIVGMTAQSSPAAALIVDCDDGGTISNISLRRAKIITILGTCSENFIEIKRDDVTIQGGPGATIVGEISVNGARRVTIKDLKVLAGMPGPNGHHGISVLNNADVHMSNVEVQMNDSPDSSGILLDRGASAVLEAMLIEHATNGIFVRGGANIQIIAGSVIQNNLEGGVLLDQGSSGLIQDATVQNNGDFGIDLINGSNATVKSTTVTGNFCDAFVVHEGSYARLTSTTIETDNLDCGALVIVRGGGARLHQGGNVITHSNNGFAIDISQVAVLSQDRGHDTVNGILSVFSFSAADFRGVVVNGEVEVVDHSTIRFRESSGETTISGSILVNRDSGLAFSKSGSDGEVHVQGNVNCTDSESSWSAATGAVAIDGTNNCTDFNN